MNKCKMEVWLVGAKTPIEIEDSLSVILEGMRKSKSGIDDSILVTKTIEDETILIFAKHIVFVKAVKKEA